MIVSATMRAVEAPRYGGPEVLELREVPVPTPGPGELLIRTAFAGVNYTDIYRRQGHYAHSPTYPTTLPFRPGIEGSGTIAAVGDSVRGVSVGDRVGFCQCRGTYAEYCVVPVNKAVKLPEPIVLEQVAAVMIQGMTAHYLSHDAYPLKTGESCLVHAGAGGVGQMLIQMAKMQGARVFATVGSPEKVEIARARGADEIILYRDVDFRDAVMAASDGRGVDVVYDSVGKATVARSLRCLRPRGVCVLFGHTSGLVECVEPMALAEAGSVYLTRPHMEHYVATPEEFARRARDVLAWVGSGRLDFTVHRVFPLTQAGDAHQLLEAREARGKILLSVADGG